MKKLLMGIFGLLLLLPIGVYAEGWDIESVEPGNNTASTTVTVGTVEAPVYQVSMVWNNTVFDWRYDSKNNTFVWAPEKICDSLHYSEDLEGKSYDEAFYEYGEIYSDDECSEVTHELEEEKNYYYKYAPEYGLIGIEDFSTNGRIIPSVKWESESKYNYVEGKFIYTTNTPVCRTISQELFELMIDTENSKWFEFNIYQDNLCSTKLENDNATYEENTYYAKFNNSTDVEITNGVIPDSVRDTGLGGGWTLDFDLYNEVSLYQKRYYHVQLKLENKETPPTLPTAGDEIGTITISISAVE